MRRLPPTIVLLLATLALDARCFAQGPVAAGAGEGTQPVDRVLAVVDDDPILDSEVRQTIELDLVARHAGESDDALRRRVLDEMISERLRFHEIDRFGFGQVPVDEVERQFQAIVQRYGKPGLQQRLAAVGMDEAGLRQLVARQLMVLTYVEERLGPRVFVSIDDIRTYYDSELVPALKKSGAAVPPIEEVREQIRSLLKERRLNEEIERWTARLRADADVESYLDTAHQDLPPLVTEKQPQP